MLTSLIAIIPEILWVVLAAYIALTLIDPVKRLVVPSIRTFKGFGIEVELFEEAISKKATELSIPVSREDRINLLRRIKSSHKIFMGTNILWVDDRISNNRLEVRALENLGAEVTAVVTSADAMAELESIRKDYDIIVSDVVREGKKAEGIAFAERVSSLKRSPFVILYVGTSQEGLSRPANVFGITNRPDELFHLMLDCLQRKWI